MMKKVLAWLLVLALTAAISIGATLAYLTDTDEDVNVMTLGKVKIDQLEYERVNDETADEKAEVQEFHDNKPLYPAVTENGFDYTKPGATYVDWAQIGKDGYTSKIWDPAKINNEVDKMVFIKNKGDYDAYVRSVFAFEAGNYETLDEFRAKVHLNLNTTDYTWEWVETPVAIPNADGTATTNYFITTATYNKVLAPGALTEISLSQIALDSSATNEDVKAFGDTYQVLVKSQGIQADGFTDAKTALNEGFGVIDAKNIPWPNDSATMGIDLRTALRNYEGNTTNSIANKVTNVVFGLNETYASIADSYTGTLVDIEQDVPVYAYYVPNDSYYDVYFLANDKIFLPNYSRDLFRDMSALKTVSCANLDTSRATNMYGMFCNCTKLTTVDTADWDVSSVTDMKNMFFSCGALTGLDVAKWDTSNVKSMAQMFLYCGSLTEMDMSNWNVSNVTSFHGMFVNAKKLETVKVDNWNPVSVTSFCSMFHDCVKLQSFDASGWKMPNLLTASHMFRGCNSATSIDVSGWYTPSLTSMDAMFHTCKSLTEVDLSSFDTSNCTELSQIFDYATGIKRVKGLEKWDTSSCKTFEQTFAGCYALEELNLSSFNTRNVVNDFYPMQNGSTGWGYKEMFDDMSNRSLKKLILGENFSFDGDGKVTTDYYKVILPSPAAKEGYIGKWQNVETGVVYDASEIPEETAATYVAYYEYASKGAKMKDALHYLNANPSGTKITANVTNVIFGRNDDYADIVNNYTGVLADQEQDVPVYAYYVDNGTGYDIYVLANDTIYAPKDSSSLFEDMSEIVTMNVENLDVSRVENATRMFRNCKKLQKLDTSNWDVSNMKTMERLFVNCYALENVDVSKWDTSNNTNFCMVFYGCTAMDKVDVSQWDTSKGTLFNSMFAYSPKFNLDREALKNWDMSSAVRINHMFYGCSAQEELDLSGWDMPNMITTTHMFADCNSLRSVDFTGWNTPSLVSMDAMFNDCHSLTYLDVSSFDTANCNEFTQVFESCKNLKTIVGLDKWDTGNARTYEELFSGCAVLKEVDLSTFKSRDVVNDFTMEWKGTGWGFLRMFSGMNSLEKMTLSADFSFDGDGKVTTESYKVSLPFPAAKEGFIAKWRNVETGVLYDADTIPEETAATYVAHYEPIATNP